MKRVSLDTSDLMAALDETVEDARREERQRLTDLVARWSHSSGEIDECLDPWGNHPEIAWCPACYADALACTKPDSKYPSAREAREYRALVDGGTAFELREECGEMPCRCPLSIPDPDVIPVAPGQVTAFDEAPR